MIRAVLSMVGVLTFSVSSAAQERRFVYPAPPASAYVVLKDVVYGGTGSDTLRMDIYRPSTGARHPTVVFFNTASGAERAHPFYVAWAQLAASKGITAILPDLRADTIVQDFVVLLGYIGRQTSVDSPIDHTALAVYAGSGNVSRALPILEDRRSTMVKSAVMYYGAADVATFRVDLPVLYVRAGLDRPAVNQAIGALVNAAVAQNAPITLVNHSGGRHAFEMVNDDDVTRQVIDQTLEFIKLTTSSRYQAALRQGLVEATAAGHVTAGRTREAVAAYAQLVATRPGDHSLRLAYGEALLADRQFEASCAELEKLKGKGLGYRDLGIPAARACMQKGDAAAALVWLQSIPARFFPPELEKDPVFAPIQDRAEFKALFGRR